jgi:hypothetical protein
MSDFAGKYLQLDDFRYFIVGGGGYPLRIGESMRARLCSHIKSDETPCRAVALAGYSRCFAHQRQLRRQQARRLPAIRLGPLADQPSILRAIGRILRAIAANSIPLERSSALFQKVLRAMVQRNRAAALTAQIGALPLNLEPRTSNLEPRTSYLEPRTSNLVPRTLPICPPTRSTLQSTKPLDSQLITCNLQPVTEFESR